MMKVIEQHISNIIQNSQRNDSKYQHIVILYMLTPSREKIKLEMHTYICTCFTLNEKESKFKTFLVLSTTLYDLHYVKQSSSSYLPKIDSTQNMPTFCAQINDKRLTKSIIVRNYIQSHGDFNAPLLTPSSYPQSW